MRSNGCYTIKGYPIKCPQCGHNSFNEKIHNFIDYEVATQPSEIEYFCAKCGESVAYWAYGSFDPAYFDKEGYMSLFQCEKCGCCENTALCWYWERKVKKQELLCSACDPTIGEWHGEFDRTYLPHGEFETNSKGDLAHKKTGETDFKKYALKVDKLRFL